MSVCLERYRDVLSIYDSKTNSIHSSAKVQWMYFVSSLLFYLRQTFVNIDQFLILQSLKWLVVNCTINLGKRGVVRELLHISAHGYW